MPRSWMLGLLIVLFVAACSDGSNDGLRADAASSGDTATTTEPPTTEPPPTALPTTQPITTARPASSTTEIAAAETGDAGPRCRRISDGTSDDGWIVVNDNVMGGRSSGTVSFQDAGMVFEGAINTNGGGFSSIRLPLPAMALDGAGTIVIRAKSDLRTYMVNLDDDLPGRDRRISHRAPIEFPSTDGWTTGRVDLDDLEAASFGRPVEADPFRADLATELGLMINDGLDGPFRLIVAWIDACP